MKSETKHNSGFAFLGISLVFSALIFGLFHYNSRRSEKTVKVTGYAVQQFEADCVKWSFSLTANTAPDNMAAGYILVSEQRKKFDGLLADSGVRADEFIIRPVTVRNQYGEYGKIIGRIIEQQISVISKDIDAVEVLAIDPRKLSDSGLNPEYSRLQFFSSQLDDLKKELLSHATINARERADEIINATDLKIVKLLSARAGVFQITEPYSTEVAGYGLHNTDTRKKSIKVTVSAVFLLK